MSADRLLLGLIGTYMLIEMFKREMLKRRCSYCGTVNGHAQNCPLGHLDQNG
jgi:hypothetical protein